MNQIKQAIPGGSYIVVSHITAAVLDAILAKDPRSMTSAERVIWDQSLFYRHARNADRTLADFTGTDRYLLVLLPIAEELPPIPAILIKFTAYMRAN